jgi:lipopolysaccharide/colanic/teichoic acid biosynthesis glycosyltransferase
MFDILFSSFALIFLLPIMLPITILLRLTGEGEIFFSQERVGKHGIYFDVLKFATMLKDSPNIGTGTVTLKKDPRILPLGSFLRTTKINELPQLFNVLIGDMSIIGPRPQTERCFEVFSMKSKQKILKMKPGLSGIGPIIFRSEEDILDGKIDFYDQVIGPYKGEVEEWYESKQKISTYITLILLTIWVVIFSNSKLVWKLYKDLPEPPEELKNHLKYPLKKTSNK